MSEFAGPSPPEGELVPQFEKPEEASWLDYVALETEAKRASEWISELEKHPNQPLVAPGFEAHSEFAATQGSFVEVGGPAAADGYELVDIDRLPRPMVISSRGDKSVHFRADARRLPLPDASVGALFANALPRGTANQKDLEEALLWAEQEKADQLAGWGDPEHPNIVAETQAALTNIQEGLAVEAGRVVEDWGLFIWGATNAHSAELAEHQGFQVVAGKYSIYSKYQKFEFILQRRPRSETEPNS